MFFKPDGLKLYGVGVDFDKFHQYTCTDAWNLSSCSYDNVNLSTQDGNPTSMFFKPDGLKLYGVGYGNDTFYQYNCSDAWNLSSCVYENINLSTQDGTPRGMFFGLAGAKLYEVGDGNDTLYQYDCGRFPTNPYLEIGTPDGTREWNYSGEFTQTNSRTDSLADSVSSYLSGCPIVNGYCLVPFLFHSDTNGTLQYSDMLFSNEGFGENSQTYNSSTYETQTQSFIINITYDSNYYISSSAELYYNGTFYAGTSFGSEHNRAFTAELITPAVDTTTNITFHWEITLSNATGPEEYNSTFNNQTVLNYDGLEVVTSCSAGMVESIAFNFMEENLTSLHTDTEYNFKYGFGGDALVSNGSFSNISHFYICINESLPFPITENMEVAYGRGLFVERSFYMFSGIELTNITTNHSLYNLPIASATSFLIKITDTSLTPYGDIFVSLMRWYPDQDEYKIVEMGRTNENGETVLKVITEDIDYRIGIYEKDGTLLKLTDPLRMVCLINPCELTIRIDEEVDFTSFMEVDSTLTFNRTSMIFTFIWNDPNQLTTLMNLSVYKLTSTSEILICSSSASGFTGVLVCDVTGNTGTLKAIVVRSASPPVIINNLLVSLKASIIDVGGGGFGLFLTLIMVVFVGLAGILNPIMGVIAAVIALIPAIMFGSITTAIVIAIAVMGFVVIHFMRRSI